MSLKVQVKILDDRIRTDDRFTAPSGVTEGSAGVDLRICSDEDIVLKAGEVRLVGTGMAFYIKDEGYAGFIYPRSGLGHKSGIILGNGTGIIDSDYQGELMISLWNRSETDFTILVGERVAQYIVAPIATPQYETVDQFDTETERGAGGFGHSGRV